MSSEIGKENIAEGLVAPTFAKNNALLPTKASKKSRSLSMGPGALSVPLKEDSGNRRKSAFIPAVKSILSGKEDEAKRREARRKSLANRRVSFAPEATLHTWDVVEYLRDATTSSSSSSASARRASSATQASVNQSPQSDSVPGVDVTEPPSTPPEQLEELLPRLLPANQREIHQKNRRRSSGIPPMNFNNPEDALSSSPYDDSSPIRSDPVDGSSDESEDTAVSLDAGDATIQTVGSDSPGDSTSSSSRLDQALRQAAVHAGTQGIEFDENGDMSMELVDDEITASFKPWVQRNRRDSLGLQKLAAIGEKENENPFSPALKAKVASRLSEQIDQTGDDSQEMSMDMTCAIGGIVKQNGSAIGSAEQRGLKRRCPSTNFVNAANGEGSPAKRQSLSRRNSLRNRRSSGNVTAHVDETMDFTMVVGSIQPNTNQEADKRHSIATSLGEGTMDFTMVVGGIKDNEAQSSTKESDEEVDANEDMSMELTATLDNKSIKVNASTTLTPKSPTTSPVKSPRTPTRPNSKMTSPGKPSTPLANKTKTLTPQKPSRKSPRKSLAPTLSLNDSHSDVVSASAPKLPTSKETERFSEQLIDLNSPQRSEEQATSRPNSKPNTRVAPASPVRKENVPTNDLLKANSEKAMSKTASLSESIKLLSTPRKQASASPTKRTIASSPKKVPTPKVPTPKRATTPRKQVRLDSAIPDADEEDVPKPNNEQDEVAEELERISLQDFLNLTNIRFMDLTTTKRRHTGYPSATAAQLTAEDDEVTVEEPNLENNVAVALAVLPMLSMYQHSCHEMKNYISGGREEIRSLEVQAYESQPPLFREYLSAPVEERAIMEGQFKNMKTNARLQSKAGWHTWRSQLLNDLKNGLEHSAEELEQDDAKIKEQENLLEDILPRLMATDEQLSQLAEQLQRRVDEMDSVDREELHDTRSRLVSTEKEIEEKKRLLAELQKQLEEKDATIETAKEVKVECAAQIKEAERVREECRGWSAAEVAIAKEKLNTLERNYGWTLTAASSDPDSLTVCYRSDLSLFFHPSAFSDQGNADMHNAPISLTYIGDQNRINNPHPRPLTTTKRFFLQLLRAHLQSVTQSQTQMSTLFKTIASGWNAALSVSEAVQLLEQVCLTDEVILSDERMAVDVFIILANLKTKVRARFVVEANMVQDDLITVVRVEARVVYGERYDESKMSEFLAQFAGNSIGEVEEMGRWSVGVEDLKGRLLKRGKKGEVV